MGLEERDAQLRGSLLVHAHLAGGREANGWCQASKLAIAALDEERHGVDSDEHAGRLLNDLTTLGLLELKRSNEAGIGGPDLRHCLLRLTDKGREWYFGRLDPIAGVEHWRQR